MKKLIVLAVLVVAVTGFAAAGGLVFQLGAGYHSSYVSADLLAVPDIEHMPLGVGGYAGLGYGFGEKKKISIGAEFAPSWDFALQDPYVSNFNYQARGFLKFKPLDILTVTGFGGYAGSSWLGTDIDVWQDNASWAVGARVTVLFLYAEYAAVLNSNYDGVAKNEIGLGFAIFK